MTDPAHILQRYLDGIAAAVLAGDWAAYRDGVTLPFQLVTHRENLHVATEAELRLGFETFAQTLRIQRITDYVRLVEGAERLEELLITGRYITHLMAGAHRVIPPFRSHVTLRRENGRWRAASITNALANSRWPVVVPMHITPSEPKGPSDA